MIPTDKGAPAWRNKVRVLHRGPSLKAPAIDKDVQSQVYEALLHNRKLFVTYQPRHRAEKEYELNPLGLVLKDGISYLVCSIREYTDIRLITLHRIKKAAVMDVPLDAPEGFDLDVYIASGELDFVISGTVQFKARFSKAAAFHLEERPLSDDQCMVDEGGDQVLLTATIHDTSELRWWLLSFGEQVEVLEPEHIRDDIRTTLQSAAQLYD